MLSDRDDRRHELSGPLARESTIFTLFLPEENLGMLAYTWVDGEGVAGSLISVFGQDDQRLAHHVVEGVAMPKDADFDEWTVGPLTLRHGAPHKEAHVSFAYEGVALDYTFDALSPAFSYHDNADGCPPFLADDRLEQSGFVRGTLDLDGRSVTFDTTGHRDHSWGVRDWDAFHHYKWINIQSDDGTGMNLLFALAIDRVYQLGYVFKDDDLSPVRSIGATLERDRGWSYVTGTIVVEDEADRTTTIDVGERSSLIVWPAGSLISRDGASICSIDGVPGIAHIEEGWKPDYVDRRIELRSKGIG